MSAKQKLNSTICQEDFEEVASKVIAISMHLLTTSTEKFTLLFTKLVLTN